jgi:polyhydroxybutyrate depolymerase
MLLRAALLWLALVGNAAAADSFAGRPLILTDGRSGAEPAPLVIVLHGFLGSGAAMQRKTRFDVLARRDGFIAIYPNGTARRWNLGAQGIDDVGYLSALIAALVAEGRADPARIYIAGHSNGGAMALRMACARPLLLRGIAVVAMNAPATPFCTGAGPLAALFIHGAEDPIVPAAGLSAGRGPVALASVDDTLSQWSARNRCSGPAQTRIFDQTAGPQTAEITGYTGCTADLVHIRLTGHGHEWPGAGPRARWVQGPASRELDASAAVWKFFSAP